MNWYEVTKYRSSGVLWHGTIQLEVWTSLRTGKAKKSKEIKYSPQKQNMDGITAWVSPLDGDNGDNLRLLPALCLCLLALRSLFLPRPCCDRACCSRARRRSPHTALMEHLSGGYTAPCLRVARCHESMLLADWLWNGDIPEEWEVVTFLSIVLLSIKSFVYLPCLVTSALLWKR